MFLKFCYARKLAIALLLCIFNVPNNFLQRKDVKHLCSWHIHLCITSIEWQQNWKLCLLCLLFMLFRDGKTCHIISHLLKGCAPRLWEAQHMSSQLLLNELYSCLGSIKTFHIYRWRCEMGSGHLYQGSTLSLDNFWWMLPLVNLTDSPCYSHRCWNFSGVTHANLPSPDIIISHRLYLSLSSRELSIRTWVLYSVS